MPVRDWLGRPRGTLHQQLYIARRACPCSLRCNWKKSVPPWTRIRIANILCLCLGLRTGMGQRDSSSVSAWFGESQHQDRQRVPTNSDALATPLALPGPLGSHLPRWQNSGRAQTSSIPADCGWGQQPLYSITIQFSWTWTPLCHNYSESCTGQCTAMPVRCAVHVLWVFRFVPIHPQYLLRLPCHQGTPTACTGCSQTGELSVVVVKGLPGWSCDLSSRPCLSRD